MNETHAAGGISSPKRAEPSGRSARVEPATAKDVVTIVSAFDNNYAPFYSTVLASLIATADPKRLYHLLVLEDAVREGEKQRIRGMLSEHPHFTLTFMDVCENFNRQNHTHGYYTRSAFSRLALPDVLPHHKKVVYLDSDTVVLRDIGELYDTDVTDVYCAAAEDYTMRLAIATGIKVSDQFGGVSTGAYLQDHVELSDELIKAYFNSGVMVLNLDMIRSDGTDRELMSLYRARSYYLVDQDILNKAFRGRVKRIDPRWNMITIPIGEWDPLLVKGFQGYWESRAEPYILHYAGPSWRPWDNPEADFADHFWQYCRQTPHYEQLLVRLMRNHTTHVANGLVHHLDYRLDEQGGPLRQMKREIGRLLLKISPRLWRISRGAYRRVRGIATPVTHPSTPPTTSTPVPAAEAASEKVSGLETEGLRVTRSSVSDAVDERRCEANRQAASLVPIPHTFQVTSFGGSGTTMLLQFLQDQGLPLPTDPDWGLWKHMPAPPTKHQYQIPIGFQAIYLVSDPVDAVLSVFRRGFHMYHALRMQSQARWPPGFQLQGWPHVPQWGISEFLELKGDCFGIGAQFRHWTTSPYEERGYPILIVKYDALWTRLAEIGAFAGLGSDALAAFPARQDRQKKEEALERAAPVLAEIYSDVRKGIDALPDLQII